MFLRNVGSNSTDYTASYPKRWYCSSDDWITVYNKLHRVWEEGVVAWLKVRSRHLPGRIEGNHENNKVSLSPGRDSNYKYSEYKPGAFLLQLICPMEEIDYALFWCMFPAFPWGTEETKKNLSQDLGVQAEILTRVVWNTRQETSTWSNVRRCKDDDEWWEEKHLQGCSLGDFECTVATIVWRKWWKSRNSSARVAIVPAKCRTIQLQ
jgi:hypothetical protein